MVSLFFSQISNITDPALQVSKGISEFGILIVLAAFFIIIAVVQIWTNNRRYNTTMDQTAKAYQDMLAKFTNGFDSASFSKDINNLNVSIHELIVPLKALLETNQAAAREEATYPQISRVIKVEIRATVYSIMESIRHIVEKNHVHENEQATYDKINRVINNSISALRQGLSLFKYNNAPVNLPITDTHIECLSSTSFLFVLSDKKDYDKFLSDINIVFDEVKTQLFSSIQE